MAEGLAAIGLAGNIIQFISFSFVLVSKTRELHESTSGLLNENIDLKIISQDISALSNGITSSARSSRRLSEIAHHCDTIARELLDAINRLNKQHVPGSGKVPTKWQSFRKALKSVWGKAHIEELTLRLARLRDQVNMHLVSNTNDNQFQLKQLLEDWKDKNMQAEYEITAQIQALDRQLQATQARVLNLQGDAYWKRLQNCFSQLSSEIHQVSQSHAIIASLRYECMHTRQSAIRDAHKKTFSWLYSHDDLDSLDDLDGLDNADSLDAQSGTGFAEWLQDGSGIYWITGKPGSGKSTLMKYLFEHDDTVDNLRIWSGDAPLVRACFYFWLPGQQMQNSLEGLLQTLLYHILHACPDLVPELCPGRLAAQYHPDLHGIASPIPWTLLELQRSIALFKTQTTVRTKFYFQVDGLDEYYGDSCDVIETLRDLSTAPNVKLCLSSRPWNCFQDSFGRSNPHVLRIHEFTRPDIELFAWENLLSDSRYIDFEPTLFNDLVRDIGERAQGVFLWVRLVVKSLRNGIINQDPVTILQERLQATPSDLEEFFEQILASVDAIYRSRMAWTFLVAMRSPRQLKLIHYYFLEQEDPTFGFDKPDEIWSHSEIQRCAMKTERRLNGRFKGLLEATPSVDITAQTEVDFLHRTLSDFLATNRMKDKLQSWASEELNVFTAISMALIAESKFIEENPTFQNYKMAVELASKGAIETGDTTHCFQVIDQAELGNEAMRPCHTWCRLNCDILRFAASLGHAEYLNYRMHKDGALLGLDHILKHDVMASVAPGESYAFCLPSISSLHGISSQSGKRFPGLSSNTKANAPLPSLVTVLFGLGANPNTIVDGVTSWTAFADRAAELMDGEHEEQYWEIFGMFLEQGVDVNITTGSWIGMLNRANAKSENKMRNLSRYFKRLFSHRLCPNATSQSTTITTAFVRTLAKHTFDVSTASQPIQHDLLREFLRNGADLSVIYRDTSSSGWFENLHQALSSPKSLRDSLSPRVAQYRIFLENGLDPNMAMHNGCTFWENLLIAMYSGYELSGYNAGCNNIVRDICLVSLQYGADPHVSVIQSILRGMNNISNFCAGSHRADIQRALHKEIDGRDCYTKSQISAQSIDGDHLGMSDFIQSTDLSPSPRDKKRQVKKRDHGQMSHGGRGSDLKRVRISWNADIDLTCRLR